MSARVSRSSSSRSMARAAASSSGEWPAQRQRVAPRRARRRRRPRQCAVPGELLGVETAAAFAGSGEAGPARAVAGVLCLGCGGGHGRRLLSGGLAGWSCDWLGGGDSWRRARGQWSAEERLLQHVASGIGWRGRRVQAFVDGGGRKTLRRTTSAVTEARSRRTSGGPTVSGRLVARGEVPMLAGRPYRR